MKRTLRTAGLLAVLAGLATGLAACGQPQQNAISGYDNQSGSIIGGQEATGSEDFTKTIVALYDVAQGSLCTASILSDSILVTAAHCVESEAKDLRVVFGVDLEAQNIIVKPVESFQQSPLWATRQNQELNTGDIAVVKFSGGLPAGYVPATLLSDVKQLKNGQTTLLSGYGIDDGVKQTGAGRLRFVETTIQDTNYSKTEVLIDQKNGKGACHGDSGGPAYVDIGGRKLLWGVTSRGVNDPNNDCSVNAAYTSIPAYSAWVKKTADALNKAKPNNRRTKVPAVAGL